MILYILRGLSTSSYRFSKSEACMFRVICGNLTTMPSISLAICTWQPSRDVSVKPNARSNMSFSSSVASGILSYNSSDSTITWQVEQAQEPPHAPVEIMVSPPPVRLGTCGSNIPSISKSLACAMSSRLAPLETSNLCWSPSLSTKVTCSLSAELAFPSVLLEARIEPTLPQALADRYGHVF